MPTFKGKQKNSQIEKELFREVRENCGRVLSENPRKKSTSKIYDTVKSDNSTEKNLLHLAVRKSLAL